WNSVQNKAFDEGSRSTYVFLAQGQKYSNTCYNLRQMSLTDASQAAVGAAITVLILTIALVAPLVYVAFYATNFTFFQKVVVVLVSLILAVAAVAVMWIVRAG